MGFLLLTTPFYAQNPVEDALRQQQSWHIQCEPKGCIAAVDILRGSGDAPPDPKDDRQYVSIAVGMNRSDQKVSMLMFEVDPRADRLAGINLLFLKTTQVNGKWNLEEDPAGPLPLKLNHCPSDTCDAVASDPAGLVTKMQSMDHVIVMYSVGSKRFNTMVSLSLFRETYTKLQQQIRADTTTPAGRPQTR